MNKDELIREFKTGAFSIYMNGFLSYKNFLSSKEFFAPGTSLVKGRYYYYENNEFHWSPSPPLNLPLKELSSLINMSSDTNTNSNKRIIYVSDDGINWQSGFTFLIKIEDANCEEPYVVHNEHFMVSSWKFMNTKYDE